MSHPDPHAPPDRTPIQIGEVWENPMTAERVTAHGQSDAIGPKSDIGPGRTAAHDAAMMDMLVMTNTGGGTVRFREGNYLSPPIVLTTQPQTVVFPLPRPENTPIDEIITIEGDATDLVIASPVTNLRTTYPQLTGTFAIKKNWVPLKTCATPAPAFK